MVIVQRQDKGCVFQQLQVSDQRVELYERGEIKITGTVLPEQVVICVSDEGPGIDAKDLPHIFDRFYRSTNAVKQTKGAGLGLYLARAIVEAHGGRIWVQNVQGSGACFKFTLPVADPSQVLAEHVGTGETDTKTEGSTIRQSHR